MDYKSITTTEKQGWNHSKNRLAWFLHLIIRQECGSSGVVDPGHRGRKEQGKGNKVLELDMSQQEFSLHSIYSKADKIMASVLWGMYALSVAISSMHGTSTLAFVIGLPSAFVPTVMMVTRRGRRTTRIAVGVSTMIFSALLIHQTHGMIEMHFFIFVLLAFLLYYRDWLPIVVAAGINVVYLLVFNYLQATGAGFYVFNYGTGLDIVLIHAAFVVFETALLVYMAKTSYLEGVQSQEIREIGKHLILNKGKFDLTYHNANARSEFAIGFNEFINSLQETVSQVQEAAIVVDRGVRELASGSKNLSQRTEEQAASIEETAASMEEMTASVHQNSNSAHEAAALTSKAFEEANRGGRVASEAVIAMSSLNEASRKIGDITSVIDGIAFQTNLLALNAAVEAARAGEQGRGFAVVASEVRSLAQKAGEAAKEIKFLIEDSVGKVQSTSNLVDSTGEALAAIVLSVKHASNIVAEITSASSEQASNIEQVNRAISQLDGMTQQNAALVEEASSVSQAIEEQARGLSNMVARFETDRNQELAGTSEVEVEQDKDINTPSLDRLKDSQQWETF